MADRRRLREKTVQLPQFDRVATVRAESFDAEASTVEIVWTTGASVRRYDWWDGAEYDEVLSVEPKAVRLERLNLGAPFLDTHCSYGCDNVIGSVVPGTASIKNGRGIATIQLSKAPGVADTVQKIREGVIRNVSVGYWIHKVEKTEADDGTVARWDVVDWEPLEISAVPIPADPGSQIRTAEQRDGEGTALRSCIVVIKKRQPTSAPKKGRKEATMATRTARAAAPTNAKAALKRIAELEAENKRLLAARDTDDKDEKDPDERDGEDVDDKDEKDPDERDGEDVDDKDEKDSDDERDGEDADEEDDGEEKDEERAGKGKRAMTAAEVRKAAEKAVRADRVRGARIREIGSQFGFPKLAERHAAGETSVREFKDLVLEKLADRQKKRGDTTFGAVGVAEIGDETRVANAGPTAQSRAYDKGAAVARALLGK